MTTKIRSVRQEQARLSAAMRSEGSSWAEVAAAIRDRHGVNTRVAIRLAHGWSQMQVAEEWSRRWPTDPKTDRNISYWELWPSKSGYQPSLEVLSRLAEIYECSVADLLADCGDFRHLDSAHQLDRDLRLADELMAASANGGAEPGQVVSLVEGAEVQHLARVAASWADRIESEETRRSVLLKLSAGLSLAATAPAISAVMATDAAAAAALDAAGLDGIWHSRYVYYSDTRSKEFAGEHYVVMRHDGADLRAESLPNNEGSQLRLALSAQRAVATGTWTERTSLTGHYRGAIYHGTLQLVIDPMGRSMVGKWLGFSKDFSINVGDWTLTRVEESTSRSAQRPYEFKI